MARWRTSSPSSGQHISAYGPLSAGGHRAGLLGDADFTSDAATDTDHCPAGQALRFLSQSEATHPRIYQAPASACTACSLRAQCTFSPRGRRISRSLDMAFLDRVMDLVGLGDGTISHPQALPDGRE